MNMETTSLEKENLEAHVDLCAQRYHILETRINKLETILAGLAETVNKGNKTLITTIIGATGTIITGLLSTVMILLFQLG